MSSPRLAREFEQSELEEEEESDDEEEEEEEEEVEADESEVVWATHFSKSFVRPPSIRKEQALD